MWTDVERDVMRDIYRLLKTFFEPQGNQEYWRRLAHEAQIIDAKYSGNVLAHYMALSVMTFLEEKLLNSATNDSDKEDDACKQLSMF